MNKKRLWKDYPNETFIQLYHKVPYAVLCAINNIRIGIAKSEYMDWAAAMGLSKKTAHNYWAKARSLVSKAPDNVRFFCDLQG